MAKYSKKIVDKICNLLKSDSYTISEVCRMVGINPDTYYDWQANKPDFSERIKKAQDDRMQYLVAEAKKSLLKKVQGYTVDESKTVYIDSKTGEKDEKGKDKIKPKIKEQTIIKKHIQPDTAAIIFTLTNGDPDNWRNRQSNEVTGKDGKDLFSSLSDDELDKKIEELEKKLKE